MDALPETLPPEIDLALAYTPRTHRDALRTAFAFDQRLARIAAATTEPMLGQMRLAWWRDMLGKHAGERPQGDAVLDAIGDHWRASEPALARGVDGWEVVVAAKRIGPGQIEQIAGGRSAAVAALFETGKPDLDARIAAAASRYVIADLASRLSDANEREVAIECALEMSCPDLRLPRMARGLGVLEALALRSLRSGGMPLMHGRGASLTALRAGILGR